MAALLLGVKAATLVLEEKSAALLTLNPVHAAPVQPEGVSWKTPPVGGFAGVLAVRDWTLSVGR